MLFNLRGPAHPGSRECSQPALPLWRPSWSEAPNSALGTLSAGVGALGGGGPKEKAWCETLALRVAQQAAY